MPADVDAIAMVADGARETADAFARLKHNRTNGRPTAELESCG